MLRLTTGWLLWLVVLRLQASQRKDENGGETGGNLAVSTQKRPGRAIAGGETLEKEEPAMPGKLDNSTRPVKRKWSPMPTEKSSSQSREPGRSPSPRRKGSPAIPKHHRRTPSEPQRERPFKPKPQNEPELKGVSVQFDYGPAEMMSEGSELPYLAPNFNIENVSSFSLSSSSGVALDEKDDSDAESSVASQASTGKLRRRKDGEASPQVRKARNDAVPRKSLKMGRERARSLSHVQSRRKRSLDRGSARSVRPKSDQEDEGGLVKVTETRRGDGGFTRSFDISARRAKGRSIPRPRNAVGAGRQLLDSEESVRGPTEDEEDSSGDGPFQLFQPAADNGSVGRKHGAAQGGNHYDPNMWYPPGQTPPTVPQAQPWMAQMLLLQQQQQALMSTALGMPPPHLAMGGMAPPPGMMTKQASRGKFNTARPRSAQYGTGVGLLGMMGKLGGELQDINEQDSAVDLVAGLGLDKVQQNQGDEVLGMGEDEEAQLIPYTPQMIWHPFYGWIPMPSMPPDPNLRHPDDEPETASQPIDAHVFIDVLAATKKGKMALETTWKFIRMGGALGAWIGVVLIVWFLGLENMILGIGGAPSGSNDTASNTTGL